MTTFYSRITESVEDLLAKSHYMVAKCQVDGDLTFDGHRKTVEEADNESRCRSLCLRIERALEGCREEEILELLEMYDLLHRIGYRKIPNSCFIASQRNRVYTSWRSGNPNIQESQIYSLLRKSVNGRPFANNMLKNWVRTLIIHDHFPNVTTYENYQRLTFIMREKVDNTLKRKLYEANRVEDLSTLTISLLISYCNFASSLFPSVLDYQMQQELYMGIISILLACEDLNIWDKKAYLVQLIELRKIKPFP